MCGADVTEHHTTRPVGIVRQRVARGVEHPGNKGSGADGRLALGEPVQLTQEEYAASVEARAKARGVDPYALIKEEN